MVDIVTVFHSEKNGFLEIWTWSEAKVNLDFCVKKKTGILIQLIKLVLLFQQKFFIIFLYFKIEKKCVKNNYNNLDK